MDIYDFLNEHGVAYRRLDHPPVFTCEEAQELVPEFEGAETKNLFLRDRKGRRHFLVVVGYNKRVDLKALSKVLDASQLRIASSDRLQRFLGLDPGSVTILGIVNDGDQNVEIVIDRELWQAEAFGCHPLVNTSTLVLSRSHLERFINATGHELKLIDVPAQVEEPQT